jgi:peroxiredoxin Q/BCP
MIQIGDKIPEFTLQNQDGTPVNIMEFIGQKTVVLYFYPKDDTPGCTKEAFKTWAAK